MPHDALSWSYVALQSSYIGYRRLYRVASANAESLLQPQHHLERFMLTKAHHDQGDKIAVTRLLHSTHVDSLTRDDFLRQALKYSGDYGLSSLQLQVAQRILAIGLEDNQLNETCHDIIVSHAAFRTQTQTK